jgi:hypothetical protein
MLYRRNNDEPPRRVLLQRSGEDKNAEISGHSQAAMSNSKFTKAAWAMMSPHRFPSFPLSVTSLQRRYPSCGGISHNIRSAVRLKLPRYAKR